jgi:tRNA (cmo5U34)-methyltransferase
VTAHASGDRLIRPVPQSNRAFFDQIAADYDAAIARCVPRYHEMLEAILGYLPPGFAPRRILELGCGTGNLTVRVRAAFPTAQLTLVDVSTEMLDACRRRFAGDGRLGFLAEDFRSLDAPPGSLDLVLSSISLHHLEHDAQAALFARVRHWLAAGGVFAYGDQFAGATPDLYREHMARWEAASRALGASSAEWDAWMAHQAAHDHHAPLPAHLAWLRAAGFTVADCVWRHVLWTVVQARA